MKQILQNRQNGTTEWVEAPTRTAGVGQLLIATTRSLISAGTERMLVDFGKASLIDKARQQPEKVKQVLDKIHTDGLIATLDAVRAKLGQPIPLGYCNVGQFPMPPMNMMAGTVSGENITDRPRRRPPRSPAPDLAHRPARRRPRTAGQLVGWAGDVSGAAGGGIAEGMRRKG